MRCWRPLSLVLALLSGCATSPGGKSPPGGPPPRDEPSVPCGRTALRMGPAPKQADTGRPELVPGARALFFIAEAGATGPALWTSGDTRGPGACLVRDFPPGPTGLAPAEPTRVGDRVFFVAEDPEHGREPWVSDGTPTGTNALDGLVPGARGSDPRGFARAGGDVFFTADDGTGPRSLWALPMRPKGQCDARPD